MRFRQEGNSLRVMQNMRRLMCSEIDNG